jgi:predicted O-methyltransferase YrrM
MRYELPQSADRTIWDLWLSMYQLPALAVADELRVFQSLAAAPLSALELSRRLALDARAMEVLLELLAALGLLTARAREYALTDLARTYLLPESLYYWGPLLRSLGVVGHPHALLKRALYAPQSATARGTSLPSHAWARGQIDRLQAELLCRIMHCHSLPAAIAAARSHAFEGVTRLLDVGAGSGCFSIALAQAHPHLRCTLLDLPAVCEVAARYVAEGDVSDRIESVALSMFHETWPSGFDAVLFSNIFHDWPAATNAQLARYAYRALRPGGRIFIHEMLLGEEGAGPVTTAAFSMLLLLGSQGRQYTRAALQEILTAAQFIDVRVEQTYGYYSLLSAQRP